MRFVHVEEPNLACLTPAAKRHRCLVEREPRDLGMLAAPPLVTIAWIAYFRSSRRVKNTFVN